MTGDQLAASLQTVRSHLFRRLGERDGGGEVALRAIEADNLRLRSVVEAVRRILAGDLSGCPGVAPDAVPHPDWVDAESKVEQLRELLRDEPDGVRPSGEATFEEIRAAGDEMMRQVLASEAAGRQPEARESSSRMDEMQAQVLATHDLVNDAYEAALRRHAELTRRLADMEPTPGNIAVAAQADTELHATGRAANRASVDVYVGTERDGALEYLGSIEADAGCPGVGVLPAAAPRPDIIAEADAPPDGTRPPLAEAASLVHQPTGQRGWGRGLLADAYAAWSRTEAIRPFPAKRSRGRGVP